MPTKQDITMDQLLEEASVEVLEAGDVVEAEVLSASRSEVWLDLGIHGTGLVPRKEINRALQLEPGEMISASVVMPDTEEGFAVLSLKKIVKEKGWNQLEEIYQNKTTLEAAAYDANRGGLLFEIEGIRGFLPVSQLTAEHYPRVSNADKEKILQKLNELVRKPLKIRILDLNREDNKLILSEKEAKKEETRKQLEELDIGETVEGLVTGTVDFGIFVNVDGIEGLIHISEISWDRVDNPADYVEVGDKIKAKIIAIDGDKLSLSMKQLKEDPWLDEIKNYSEGDIVEGRVTRITPFGAFIQITPAIEALVHVSELGEEEQDPDEIFTLDQERTFEIIDIDTESRKISLRLAQGGLKSQPAKSAAEEE